MGVSIDKEPADAEDANTRGILASWLDDYTAGRCDRAQMQASFLDICRSNPEAPWDALALLDQYQRRGRIDMVLARSLKSDIAQLVFGVANQTEAASQENRDPSLDTTGSRWRKLAAQREVQARNGGSGGNAEETSYDPTKFRRDFDPLTRPPAAAAPPPPERSAAAAAGGALRNRYELLTVLGRGSAGTVYKALDRHRAHLPDSAQCVAVKVLKLDYRQRPEALAELEREFHQAQSLSHQNIVSMFDLDKDRDTYFLVMELLEGELLADILRRLEHRPMARNHALSIIGGIGAALAHAHRRGVVHADLKPRNVMITSTGELKVLDFGFARGQPLEPWISDPSAGGPGVAHTPAYASAERVNGEQPHPSEDVYSLACIAYELLSGQHPYGGRSAPLARAHGREPQRIPGLSNKQWGALRSALQWSRSERQIDVVELIAGLGCADVPQRLAPPEELVTAASQPEPADWRQRRGLAIASLAVLVIAIALALFLGERWLPQRVTDASALPVTQQENPGAGENIAPVTDEPAAAAAPPENQAVTQVVSSGPETVASATTPAASEPSAERPAKPAATTKENPAVTANEAIAARGRELIQFDKDTYVTTESDGAVTLTVRRTGSTREPAQFRWSLQSNSAESGNDFAAIGPNIESIPAGSRTAVLTIPLVSDAIAENTELFLVELSQTEDGPPLGELTRAAVILVDDD